jgi:hypothetical protein
MIFGMKFELEIRELSAFSHGIPLNAPMRLLGGFL